MNKLTNDYWNLTIYIANAGMIFVVCTPFCIKRWFDQYLNMRMPSAWGPFFVTDQIAIEKIQKHATKMVSTIKNLPYNECLIILKLPIPSLYYHRKRGDMIQPNPS